MHGAYWLLISIHSLLLRPYVLKLAAAGIIGQVYKKLLAIVKNVEKCC